MDPPVGVGPSARQRRGVDRRHNAVGELFVGRAVPHEASAGRPAHPLDAQPVERRARAGVGIGLPGLGEELFRCRIGDYATRAQGQEPVKQLPAVSEPSESAAPLLYNKYESEPNNTRATADPMAIGDVMGGNIYESDCDAGLEDDIDWFSFQVTDEEYILVDVDTDPASYFGLDTDLCLLNAAGE